MNIIVTTPKSQMANAKKEAEACIKAGGGSYFRRLGRCPQNLNIGDRVFYVEDGAIRGFALIDRILSRPTEMCFTTGREWPAGTYVYMEANTWKWIKPIPMKGFQGWRYFNLRPVEIVIVGGWLDPKPKP